MPTYRKLTEVTAAASLSNTGQIIAEDGGVLVRVPKSVIAGQNIDLSGYYTSAQVDGVVSNTIKPGALGALAWDAESRQLTALNMNGTQVGTAITISSDAAELSGIEADISANTAAISSNTAAISANAANISENALAAMSAQITADLKARTYAVSQAPSGTEGDLWVDIHDGYRLYRRSPVNWVDVSDARIADNAENIRTNALTINNKADISHEHTVLPFAYAFQNDQTVRVTKRRGLISGTAVGTAGSLYWPWVIRVDDKIENPLGKYYMYISPDHAYSVGLGIELYYSDSLISGWTRYGVVYRIQQYGAYKETETPSVVWDHDNSCFIMYLHGSSTYSGEAQTTWRLTSSDGVAWDNLTKLFDLDGERLHGNLHNGYFLPFRLGDMYFGYSLMGGGSGGSALHWSEDGYSWTTDHRKLGRWMIRSDNRCLFPHHGTVVFFQGMYWFLGVYSNIVSGTTAKISRIAMAPLSDLRTPYGKPRILVAPDGDCEADDLRSISVFCENGRLYVYYSCATSEASWVNCAVIEDGASSETGGFEEAVFISRQPSSLTLTRVDTSGELSIAALASDGSELTYQWYTNTSALNQGGAIIDGATNSTYTLPGGLIEGTYYYYCVVSSPTLGSVTSNVATLTVDASPVISFTQQPGDTTVVAGSITESLTALASISDGSNLSYQWYSNTTNSTDGGTIISGATGTTYALPANLAKGEHYYYCMATSVAMNIVRSSCATVTVVAYVAKYSLIDTANTAVPSAIADISGNNNTAITVNGVTSRDEDGSMMLTGTGQSLYLPSIANLPANYKIHIGFSRATTSQHRIFMIPAHDLNALIANSTPEILSDHVKLESSSADAGFTSPMSLCTLNTWQGINNYLTLNATLDIAVSGDELVVSFDGDGNGTHIYGENTRTVVGFTAALGQGIYLGNRQSGDRPLGGAITEFWIEEV